MKRSVITVVVGLIVLAGGVVAYRESRTYAADAARAAVRASLPKAEPFTGKNVNAPTPAPSAPTHTNKNLNAPSVVNAVNLDVPFTSQAPFKVWDAFHEDACEEASVLMVSRYFSGKSLNDPQEADDALHAIADWENGHLGFSLDTTAAETARILKEDLGFKRVDVVADPTVETIKKALRDKLPVIVPADGKELENPNFKNGGPVYHMLVVKGFTADGKWITNDPGTRLGADFLYREQNIMDSMHDWNGGDVPHGKKVVIIAHPN